MSVSLPSSLSEYLERNGLNPSSYLSLLESSESAPRFALLFGEVSEQEIATQCKIEDVSSVKRVMWLDRFVRSSVGGSFFCLPSSADIRGSSFFQKGEILGIEASSLAAVCALFPEVEACEEEEEEERGRKKRRIDQFSHSVEGREENILELCCAPGTKLCVLGKIRERASKLSENLEGERRTAELGPRSGVSGVGRLIGVDLSRHRLEIARSQVKRLELKPFVDALILADGCTWGGEGGEDILGEGMTNRERKLIRRAKKKAEKAGVSGKAASETVSEFDRVLVDAECSHDGSIKHVLKSLKKSALLDCALQGGLENTRPLDEDTKVPADRLIEMPWLSEEKNAELVQLQGNLLANAFHLLKPGGVLVYSTCSLSFAQNEGVILEFLKKNRDAELDPIPFLLRSKEGNDGSLDSVMQSRDAPASPPLPHLDSKFEEPLKYKLSCCRFDPVKSFAGGMFIARMKKLR